MNSNNVAQNGDVRKEIALHKIKEKIEDLKNNASDKINEQLQKITNEIVKEIEKNGVLSEHSYLSSKYYDQIEKKVQTEEGRLPDKQFMKRNSMLTDLFADKHIQTIYHIFLAIMFGLFVNTTVNDLLHKGQIKCGTELIFKSFSNLHSLLFIWVGMLTCTCSIYTGFYFWSTIRIQIPIKSYKLKIWDRIFLGAFIAYIPLFIIYFTSTVIHHQLSIAESIAALCEVMRFLMKSCAFVRSNTPRALRYKVHNEDQQVLYPEFKKFLYFLFIPTLIYKDAYPRTNTVRWNYVALCFMEVFGAILYVSFIFERFLVPVFQDFGTKHYSWQDITMIILGNGMAGVLVLLCTFYSMLHSWMNGFAEMLRFGDRMFYKDWWTSTSYSRYYRTWNVVVHDWLYTYIYKDMYEIVCPKNKVAAKFMVFFVSAIFHEFILGFAFRFCFPLLFIEFFGIGLAFSFVKLEHNSLGNMAMWYSLSVGMGLSISAYCMEFYIRANCPIEDPHIIDYFVPRIFTCDV